MVNDINDLIAALTDKMFIGEQVVVLEICNELLTHVNTASYALEEFVQEQFKKTGNYLNKLHEEKNVSYRYP